LKPSFEEASESGGHLEEMGCGMAIACAESIEIGFFEGVVNFILVVFCYVKYEWT